MTTSIVGFSPMEEALFRYKKILDSVQLLFSFCSDSIIVIYLVSPPHSLRSMAKDVLVELIELSKSVGGIALRHQILVLHQNGARFKVKRAYLDDGLLDLNIPYTLLIVPETASKSAPMNKPETAKEEQK